jgi:hypothetical protein
MREEKGDLSDTAANRRYAPDELVLLYRIRRSVGWIAFFMLLIAAGSAIGAYFLWQQLGVAQDQMEELSDQVQKNIDAVQKQTAASEKAMEDVAASIRQSIDASNKLAAAAQRLAESATNGQAAVGRPWLGIEPVVARSLVPRQPYALKIVVRNSGSSPALKVRATFHAAVSAIKDFTLPNIDQCENCLTPIVLPNAVLNYDVTVSKDIMTREETNRIKDSTDTIFLLGRIDYADAAATAHSTTVCMSFASKSNSFHACDQGNNLN